MADDPAETLIEDLQRAYQEGSGVHPSNEPFVRKKWHRVARYVLSRTREKVSVHHLAVELHNVFIGVGHRTEIEHRADDDPAVLGWRAVAGWVLRQQNTPQAATASPL
jgi:hypothetical protein